MGADCLTPQRQSSQGLQSPIGLASHNYPTQCCAPLDHGLHTLGGSVLICSRECHIAIP